VTIIFCIFEMHLSSLSVMSLLPSFILVFDSTALLAGNTHDWQNLAHLGECFVPVAVWEEIRSLNDRAPDAETEAKAREFARFYTESGWKRTDALAEHSSLNPVAGHTLSKRARLSLEVLECAYGLARRHPQGLVILVANDQPMLQRLTPLRTHNLCGVPFATLLQWSRTQRKPETVSKHLQLMRSSAAASAPDQPSQTKLYQSAQTPRSSPSRAGNTQTISTRSSSSHRTAHTNPHRLATISPNPPRSSTAQTTRRVQSYRRSTSLNVANLIATIASWTIPVIVVLVLWRAASPTTFDQFWQQLPWAKVTLKK
jgi:PIN domain